MRRIPGLDERDGATLETILEPLLSRYRLALFGSRASGRARSHSDIDILIQSQEPVPLGLLAQVETELSESSLPVTVDLVDGSRASPEFRRIIEPDLMPM